MDSAVAEKTPDSQNLMRGSLVLSERATRWRKIAAFFGNGTLLLITSSSAFAVLFIFYYIAKDAIPFFWAEGFGLADFWARLGNFFGNTSWYPSRSPDPEFGAASIFIGSLMVTLGAVLVAVPLGVAAAICLSDVLPFSVRQCVKPVIEILAAIPSVAFGFFALVVFAPALQQNGGHLLAWASWLVGVPFGLLAVVVLSDLLSEPASDRLRPGLRGVLFVLFAAGVGYVLWRVSGRLAALEIDSGTNALNVSIILGVMALPTVVSVSEDALQAAGRELREGSYALGATRAETMIKVVVPAASSGICAAIILGVMRAIGETMVVWMASGNAAQPMEHWFDFLKPVRTLTATIAGDMGEADHVTGSDRFHVLFAMALCLLAFSFICNMVSEWAVRRSRRKMGVA
jgi:phosphate transport system permease protein